MCQEEKARSVKRKRHPTFKVLAEFSSLIESTRNTTKKGGRAPRIDTLNVKRGETRGEFESD